MKSRFQDCIIVVIVFCLFSHRAFSQASLPDPGKDPLALPDSTVYMKAAPTSLPLKTETKGAGENTKALPLKLLIFITEKRLDLSTVGTSDNIDSTARVIPSEG